MRANGLTGVVKDNCVPLVTLKVSVELRALYALSLGQKIGIHSRFVA